MIIKLLLKCLKCWKSDEKYIQELNHFFEIMQVSETLIKSLFLGHHAVLNIVKILQNTCLKIRFEEDRFKKNLFENYFTEKIRVKQYLYTCTILLLFCSKFF